MGKRKKRLKKIKVELVRRDEIEIELDKTYFDARWLKNFREGFYDVYNLQELAEFIAYSIIHNGQSYVAGIGTPLRDKKKPYWLGNSIQLNRHVNVMYDPDKTRIAYKTTNKDEEVESSMPNQ